MDLSIAKITMNAYSGRLGQVYDMKDFTLKLQLIFASSRTTLIQTEIHNKTHRTLNLDLSWSGQVFDHMKQGNSELDLKNNLSTLNNGVQVNFVEQRNTWNYFMTDEVKYQICHSVPVKTKVDGHHYVSEMTKPMSIRPQSSFVTTTTESYTFTQAEAQKEAQKSVEYMKDYQKIFGQNKARWQSYINKTVENRQIETPT